MLGDSGIVLCEEPKKHMSQKLQLNCPRFSSLLISLSPLSTLFVWPILIKNGLFFFQWQWWHCFGIKELSWDPVVITISLISFLHFSIELLLFRVLSRTAAVLSVCTFPVDFLHNLCRHVLNYFIYWFYSICSFFSEFCSKLEQWVYFVDNF